MQELLLAEKFGEAPSADSIADLESDQEAPAAAEPKVGAAEAAFKVLKEKEEASDVVGSCQE